MPSIRVVNVGLSVSLVLCVGSLASLLSVSTYEKAIDQTEESMQSGVDRSFAAGETNTLALTEMLSGRTVRSTLQRVQSFLRSSRDLVEQQGSFASRFPQDESSTWDFTDQRIRPMLYNRYELLGAKGAGVLTSVAYIHLGGDPRGGAAGYLSGLRDGGPRALWFYEEAVTSQRPPDDFHFIWAVEEDGTVPDWWHDGVWVQRDPSCADTIADSPACTYGRICTCEQLTALAACHATADVGGAPVDVDSLCKKSCGGCGAAAAPAAPECTDTLPESPACSFGGICTCKQLTAVAACGTTANLGGQSVVVNDLCAEHCGACGTPPAPAPCVDALPDSPACAFGGVCACEQLTAMAACGTDLNMAGQTVVVNDLCAKHCSVCVGDGTPAAAPDSFGKVPIGTAGPLGEMLLPEPGVTGCNLSRAIALQQTVSLGVCSLPAKSIGWTLWQPHNVRMFTELPPMRPHWLGLTALGSPQVSLTIGWCWTTAAYNDSVYGNRAGCVQSSTDITTLSSFLSEQQQSDLPRGYRLYIVTRDHTPEYRGNSLLAAPPNRTIHTDMLVAASHPTGARPFVKVGETATAGLPSVDLVDVMHCTNATDSVIQRNCVHLLSLGSVRPGGDGERYGFDTKDPTQLDTWEYRNESDGGRELYYQRVVNLTDDAGLNLRLVLLIPRDAVMRRIDEETMRVRLQTQRDREATQEQRREGLVVMAVTVVASSLALVVLSVVFTMSVTGPLITLQLAMARVAVMDLDGVDSSSGKGSMLSEVSSMYQSFDGMIRNLIEYRSYMPQSVLVQDDDDDQARDDCSEATGLGKSRSSDHTEMSAASKGTSRSAKSSHRGVSPPKRQLTELGLRRRGMSFTTSSLRSFLSFCGEESVDAVVCLISEYVEQGVSAARRVGGIVDGFQSDAIYFTFNGPVANPEHCAAAVNCGLLMQGCRSLPAAVACSTGKVLAGNVGTSTVRKYAHIGAVSQWMPVLVQLAVELQVQSVLTDSAVQKATRQNFVYKLHDVVLFERLWTDPIPLLEHRNSKALREDEWMYQLQEAEAGDPYSSYNSVLRAHILGQVTGAEAVRILDEGGAERTAEVSQEYAELQARIARGTVSSVRSLRYT